MHPVLFSIGPITLYTASFIIAFGFIVSLFLFWQKTRIEIIEEEKIFDFILVFIFSAFIFGRLVYVLEHVNDFSFWIDRIIHIYKYPGFNIWGLCFGGILGAFLFARKKIKTNLSAYLLDALSVIFSFFLSFLFIGFFFDGVYVGQTSEILGVNFVGYAGKRLPIQLFAGLIFLVFYFFSRKVNLKKSRGMVFWLFCSFFFSMLLALEFFRGDRIYFEGIVINKFTFFLVGLFSGIIFILKYKKTIFKYLNDKLTKK